MTPRRPDQGVPAAQHGAALLAAMLTVTLVATLAAGAVWQQWRAVAVETAERARAQSSWLLVGAQDWSRLIVREDARSSNGSDHLGEPWAIALEESRLSSFLAQQGQETDFDRDAFLSGQMIDLQSRMNVANLLDNQKISAPDFEDFARLFEALGLPPQELALLANGWLAASNPSAVPATTAVPLLPQRVEQLAWLGLSAATLRALQPHITLLPERTTVNLNTADAKVLQACLPGIDRATVQRLVAARSLTPFNTLGDATRLLGMQAHALSANRFSVATRYFEVRGQIRLDDNVVQERAVIQRNGMSVRTLWRERGVLPPLPTMAAS